jgi:mannose-6-phosphate isomerase-like protein (cupin superfamily)
MNRANIADAADWFAILQTTPRAQTAVMALRPGQSSSDEPDKHPRSDQVVLVLSGSMQAQIAGEPHVDLREGDIVIVPPGTPHKFTNSGPGECVSFSIYTPPAYDQSGEPLPG